MADTAISVQHICKRYQVFAHQRARILHALSPHYTKGVDEVWALRDISFEVERGDSFAIIGRNGGGKSTLLEIITQTLAPTSGQVRINGRVAALLELGSGFNPEYTGRENVFLNGLLLGLTRPEIEERFDKIASFADIGDVLDRPTKTYSSGMLVRLAFAVQVALEPDILIVDEALSVGDYFFQQKCFAHLRQMRNNGLTLLFVSHDMGTVRDLCQRALYLRHGEMVCCGETQSVIRRYFAEGNSPVAPLATIPPPTEHTVALPQFSPEVAWSADPTQRKHLLAVRILNQDGLDTTTARLGDTLRIQVYFTDCAHIPGMRVGITLKNRYDQIVTAQNSGQLGLTNIVDPALPHSAIEFETDLMLEAGLYSFRLQLSRLVGNNRGEQIDATPWLGPIHVQWDYENAPAPFLGLFGVPMRVRQLTSTASSDSLG
jgi:lipopolysaccharide transport system ATP-binding protein